MGQGGWCEVRWSEAGQAGSNDLSSVFHDISSARV